MGGMIKETDLGGMRIRFRTDAATGRHAMEILPLDALDAVVAPRAHLSGVEVDSLPQQWQPMAAGEGQSHVQLHVRGDRLPKAFAGGQTLRDSDSVAALQLVGREAKASDGRTLVSSRFTHPSGLEVTQFIEGREGARHVRVWTEAVNNGGAPVTLDMLASFCIDGITPFDAADAPERLVLHRFQSTWSAEGRHEARLLEELSMERSWAGYGVRSLRFGQVGSMPVRGYFPVAIIEDREAGVCWGAQLDAPASWQLEVYRRQDRVSLSGGLADREFGHWWKALQPGERLASPAATLTAVRGDCEDACHALIAAIEAGVAAQTEMESGLPHIFNEWSSTWGNPRESYVLETAARLQQTRTRYLVIDDGWAEKPRGGIQSNGDWNVNRELFPDGLKATCDKVRAMGLTPGIWFEFEVCTEGTRAYEQSAHHLWRDGAPLEVGGRRFWDFRDPWVRDYLREKVIGLIRESGIGYLKVDYNDTLGIGCDATEPGSGPGEGLRQHIAAVQDFFRELREALPELVIENCSSGGHRLEPSFIRLASMCSFSDAHECLEIPIISANLHRLMPARAIQIWSVHHAHEDIERTRYLLSATFLGRMCLSGDIKQLDDARIAEIGRAQAFHEAAAPVILDGRSRVVREIGPAWRHPRGWQAVVRASGCGSRVLVVLHAFADCPESVSVPLPAGDWRIGRRFGDEAVAARVEGGRLRLNGLRAFTGHGLLLEPGN
jgi:alpha-galactosidase